MKRGLLNIVALVLLVVGVIIIISGLDVIILWRVFVGDGMVILAFIIALYLTKYQK